MRSIHLGFAAFLLAALLAGVWLSLRDSTGVALAGSSVRGLSGGSEAADLGAADASADGSDPGTASTRIPLAALSEDEASEPAQAHKKWTRPKLVGRVVDPRGAGIPGASVFASTGNSWIAIPLDVEPEGVPKGWIRVERTTSDAEGRFEFETLDPGPLRIAARAPGFAPHYSDQLDLRDEEECRLADVRMEPGAVLAGKVVDAAGKGVAGTTLLLAVDGAASGAVARVALPGRGIPLARTDPDGTFRIDELAAGPWRLIVDAPGHAISEEEGRIERPGERRAGLLFRVERGFEILGRVRVEDGAGSPDGLRVSARPSPERESGPRRPVDEAESIPAATDARSRTAVCDADGAFVVRGVRGATRYGLTLSKPADEPGGWKRLRSSEPVFAWAGQRGVELVYKPEAALLFRVLDGRTGEPLTAFSVWAGIGREQALRDEKGKPVQAFPEGRVRYGELYTRRGGPAVVLRVAAVGFKDLERKDIVLDPGRTLDLGDLRLETGPLVLARVVDGKTGAPVEGARVLVGTKPDAEMLQLQQFGNQADQEFSSEPGLRSARTDAQGRARLSSLPGKAITACAGARGFLPSEPLHATLPEKEDHAIELRLKHGGTVVVQVRDGAGLPVAGVAIEHRPPGVVTNEEDGEPETESKKTGADGDLLVEALAPGVHAFRVAEGLARDRWNGGEQEDRGKGWIETVASEGSRATLEFRAPSRGGLHGRIREAGRPLEGARLHVVEVDGEEQEDFGWFSPGVSDPSTASSDHEGRYRFENLRCGSYRLLVTHSSRRMPAVFDVEISNPARAFDADLDVASLEGRVTGEDDAPLAGIQVQASAGDGHDASAQSFRMVVSEDDRGSPRVEYRQEAKSGVVTDANGRYVLRGVRAGEPLTVWTTGDLVVHASLPGITLGPDEARRGVDFVLAYAGAIDVQLAGKAAGGRGGEWYQVRALRIGEDGKEQTVQMNYLGSWNQRCRLRSLPPGKYKVALGAGEEQDGPPLLVQEVDVAAGVVSKITFQPR